MGGDSSSPRTRHRPSRSDLLLQGSKDKNFATPPSLIGWPRARKWYIHFMVILLVVSQAIFMYSSYSLFISCFAVTLRTKGKGQILPFEFKIVHARPRERKTPARQAAGAQASPVRYVCCNTSTYASNSQVRLRRWGWKSVCNKTEFVIFTVRRFQSECREQNLRKTRCKQAHH